MLAGLSKEIVKMCQLSKNLLMSQINSQIKKKKKKHCLKQNVKNHNYAIVTFS